MSTGKRHCRTCRRPWLLLLPAMLFLSTNVAWGQPPKDTIYSNHTVWPLTGLSMMDEITSVFGIRSLPDVYFRPHYDFHRGIDLHASLGSPVNAADSGGVTDYYYSNAMGRTLTVSHYKQYNPNLNFLYAHLDTALCEVGWPFARGAVLANSGNTGTTTAHLHVSAQTSIRLPWESANPKRNPVRYLPRDTTLYGANRPPWITSADTALDGDMLEYLTLHVAVHHTEMDFATLEIMVWSDTVSAGQKSQIIYALDEESASEWTTYSDTGIYHSLHEDSLVDSTISCFTDSYPMAAAISVWANEYDHWNDTVFVLNITIDPWFYFLTPKHWGVRVRDVYGKWTEWGSVDSPAAFTEYFVAENRNGVITLTAFLSNVEGLSALRLLRVKRARDDSIGVYDSGVAALSQGHQLVVADSGADPTMDYTYVLLARGSSGPEFAVASCTYHGLPGTLSLSQNYPNPFNPETAIEFEVPVAKSATTVTLTIYNTLGQVVRILHDGVTGPGRYTKYWDATSQSGERVASGCYFYRLDAGSFTETKKMLLIK